MRRLTDSASTSPALRATAVVLSACGYAAAFPPWSCTWIAFVALVPLLWALQRSTPRGAVISGFVWGALCISFFGYWVPVGLATYWQQPVWFGFLFALGVAVVFKGSYFVAFGWCYRHCSERMSPVGRVLLGASLYVACELARAKLLTGHPWLLLGYAAVPYTTWAQMADIGGVYLLSFGIFVINAVLLELATRTQGDRSRRGATTIVGLAVVIVPLAYGAVRERHSFGTDAMVRVGVVQGNLDLGTQWRDEFYGLGLERYLRMSYGFTHSEPDLVVWPESAMTFFLDDSPDYLAPLRTFATRTGAEVVAGGPYFKPGSHDEAYYNSAFLVGAEGIAGRYDKVHLLPFAEYFPLRTIRFLRRKFERVRSFVPATVPRLLETTAGQVGVLICFEAIFPELVRREVRMGAEMLFNLSNDAWLQSSAGAEQHLLMTRLRAIETRRWLVRATTTGVSAIVDPTGRLHGRIEADIAGTLLADIRRVRIRTVYVWAGDVFAWLCALAGVATLTLVLRPRVS